MNFTNKSIYIINELENDNSFEVTTLLNENATSVISSWVFRIPFNNVGIIVAASFILPMAILGIFCNFVTIVVIYNSEKLKSIFNLYILSLSVSDLLSAVISPLMLYRRTWGYEKWQISTFLCKLYWGGDLVTSISTSLHILSFCVLRYVAIAKPLQIGRIKMHHAKASIVVIWIVSIFCGGFTHGLWVEVINSNRNKDDKNRDRPDCTINLKWLKEFKNFSLYGHLLFYYIPLVGVAVFSLAIGLVLFHLRSKRLTVNRNEHSTNDEAEVIRQNKENQAVFQLILIVASYLFGYIPISVYYIMVSKLNNFRLSWWFNMIAYICMRFSECLNPFFYNLASSNLRNETLIFLRKMFNCKNNYRQNQSSSNDTSQRSNAVARVEAVV